MKVLSFLADFWQIRLYRNSSRKRLLCSNVETESIDSNPPWNDSINNPVLARDDICKTESNLIDFFDENTDPASPMNKTQGLSEISPVSPRPPTCPLQWTKGELIGSGAFGKVYLGFNQDTGHLLAIKQVQMPDVEYCKEQVTEHIKALELEVDVLRRFTHMNIVRYLGIEHKETALNIFLEYAAGGSVASLLSKFGAFKEPLIRSFTRQILKGLEYLHQQKIAHRDIKGGNILVDHQGVVKLADFGASKRIENLVTLNSGLNSLKGTPNWMAPEVIKQTGHGRQADIWSVGCTVIEMATGKPPWSEVANNLTVMFHIASSKGTPPIPEQFSHEARDFLKLCFTRNPKERPNASRLLLHPFVANVGHPDLVDRPPVISLPSPVERECDLDPSLVLEIPSNKDSEDLVNEDRGFCLDELQNNTLIKQQWAIELEKELKEMKNRKTQHNEELSLF
eukprot:g35.t1